MHRAKLVQFPDHFDGRCMIGNVLWMHVFPELKWSKTRER